MPSQLKSRDELPWLYYPRSNSVRVINSHLGSGGGGGTKLSLPGTSGNNASSPDNAALTPATSLSLRIKASADWTPAAKFSLLSKWANGSFEYLFEKNAGNGLRLLWSDTGAYRSGGDVTISNALPFTDNTTGWVRADLTLATASVSFFTSTDGSSWTQLGSTVNDSVTSILNGTSNLVVGAQASGADPMTGDVYEVQLYVDGVLVWNPIFENESVGTTSFTESSGTGATVTINQSGSPQAEIVAA